MKKYQVGIVGGFGYIGFSLTNHPRKKFYIRIIDVKPPKTQLKDAEYIECDKGNHEEVESGLKGLDLVIHTAAIQILRTNEKKQLGYYVNTIGTQNVCKAVEESRSIIGSLLTGSLHACMQEAK